jgi:proteasome lid subunit RPN8/RPN11
MFDAWEIPIEVLEETAAAFARGDHEVFVLWATALGEDDGTCRVVRCIVPDQQPGRTGLGVYVRMEGRELARIQYENFDRKERSVVQLHTHPSRDVDMSDLDRQWEVVNHVGALSVIVPRYGQDGLHGFPVVGVYEREPKHWRLWSGAEIGRRFRVVR